VKKLISTVSLFCLTALSLYGQNTAPAVLRFDGHGNSTLAIPGQGTQFDVHTSSTVFSGTRDDQLVQGYNLQPNGSRYNNSEPQIRLALEGNYNDGIAHNLEWNLDMVPADFSHDRRWMYLKVNRNNPLTGNWAFWGTDFSLQDYYLAGNDAPSEYFTVTNAGIARITSPSGQPSEIQLNTTDNSGFPGSYAYLVFQRGYQTKWTVNNKGSNGDSLSIVGTFGEVASFTQSAVFTSKGQRASVTTVASAYTAAASDLEIRVDCTNGAVPITLPVATSTGQIYRVIKVDGSGNAVVITCVGNGMIDGAPSASLVTRYRAVTLVDGALGIWDKY
jgi:hypothetical protein